MARLISATLTLLSLALLAVGENKTTEFAKSFSSDATAQAPFSGRFTFYNAEVGLVGACGTLIRNSDFAVALNTAQYGAGFPGPNCFKKINIRYKNKSAQAIIADQCPSCSQYGLDLTIGLFQFLTDDPNTGIISGEWEFV